MAGLFRVLAIGLFLWPAIAACAQDSVPSGVDAVPDAAPAVVDGPPDPAGPAREVSPFPTWLLIGCGLLWIYLLVIRPGSRQKAERVAMAERLKTNADVVTIGGIHGTVTKVSDEKNTVTIKVDQNTRITVNKDAIREVLTPSADEKADAKS